MRQVKRISPTCTAMVGVSLRTMRRPSPSIVRPRIRATLCQNNLGSMYQNGKGVPQDYAQALAWYRKAVDQNLSTGQYNLGFMYEDGEGVTKDYAQALLLYRKAADQGDANAEFRISSFYESGLGVSRDLEEARKWFQKASAHGLKTAKDELAKLDVPPPSAASLPRPPHPPAPPPSPSPTTTPSSAPPTTTLTGRISPIPSPTPTPSTRRSPPSTASTSKRSATHQRADPGQAPRVSPSQVRAAGPTPHLLLRPRLLRL